MGSSAPHHPVQGYGIRFYIAIGSDQEDTKWARAIVPNSSSSRRLSTAEPQEHQHQPHRHAREESTLPQIAIKRKDNDTPCSRKTEVVLLNGNWDTSYKIPNLITEMHNVDMVELQALKGGCSGTGAGGKQMKVETAGVFGAGTPSPMSSDSGIEGDCTDGNLSWLLNYKINELPPVPDCVSIEQYAPVRSQQILPERQDHHHQQQQQLQYAAPYHHHQQEQQFAPKIGEKTEKEIVMAYKCSGPKKPPFTYTELIEHALVVKGELTVSGIYQWISDHFPFYKQNDDRWKNSVRHNLSINPHFRKGSKAAHGAGHLWTIAQKEDPKTWNLKKQRMQQFIQTTMSEYTRQKEQEIELATATASILPQDNEYQHNGQHHNEMPVKDVKRLQPQNVEVEYVIDMSGGLGDFLCPPVTKEQVAEECGLAGDYLITDLNPTALGLNLTEAEIMNGANLYDDLNFQCYELHTD